MYGSITDRMMLNDGYAIPYVGLGTDKLSDEETIRNVVSEAMNVGIRYFDCADWYGNEDLLGKVFAESSVKREELYILTKLNNPYQGYQSAMDALKRSLEKLKLDYVDMFLIHWPGPDATNTKYRLESWKAMIELREQGLTRSIGVSNFQKRHLKQLIDETGVAPAINQVERHPWQTNQDLIDYAGTLGIKTVAWAPYMRGLFKDVPVLYEIGEKYGKKPTQIISRWNYQSGIGAIPKSTKIERIAENADIFDFCLTEEEMQRINAQHKDYRLRYHPDTMDVNFPESVTKM